MLKFDLTKETEIRISKAFFKKYVDRFYKLRKKDVDQRLMGRDGEIALVLIGDERMKDLNAEYRKKNGPTDVISFAYLEIMELEYEEGDVIAGDIFLSIDTAKRQAEEKGHSLNVEIAYLFVHGLLHCFGFDHQTDEEEAEMEKWAKKVLAV